MNRARERELFLFASQLILMLLIPLAYSLYELWALGIATEHYAYTYLPMAASVLSAASICLWIMVLLSDQQQRSFKKGFAAWSAFIASVFFGNYPLTVERDSG